MVVVLTSVSALISAAVRAGALEHAGAMEFDQVAPGPRAALVPAPRIWLSGGVDSNSPAVWDRVRGRPTLFVFTSFYGPSRATSTLGIGALGEPAGITVNKWPPGQTWLEAVVPADDGTWFGFYHNERDATGCPENAGKAVPRLGAMRSTNRGLTWKNLGTVLAMRKNTEVCGTPNGYFAGGVGDFSALLDEDAEYLYFFYSQYVSADSLQGVAVARLPWADRHAPEGKIAVYDDGDWVPARTTATGNVVYPVATPLFPVGGSWHDDSRPVTAYWGPSVHWNTHLNQYVMLLNHASDMEWSQEGVYISFAPRLDDPKLWSPPRKLLQGGRWYPQVFGLETGIGTDKYAGEVARFYMSGSSEYFIQFVR